MLGQATNGKRVSFDNECLILVDEADEVQGHASKVSVHRGDGKLHRAFSIFIFNGADRVLLHQRSKLKPLWPGFWTNSCCSHPREGESYEQSTRRRLQEELGIDVPLTRLYQFEYRARYLDVGTEHELCSVYVGNVSEDWHIEPNNQEIQDWGWFDCNVLDDLIRNKPTRFTPWFRMEWERLRGDQYARVQAICGASPANLHGAHTGAA
ncbi:MAG: isopentenyl-diphosphate Delta-isomerase [Pseudomonadota bacterium]